MQRASEPDRTLSAKVKNAVAVESEKLTELLYLAILGRIFEVVREE